MNQLILDGNIATEGGRATAYAYHYAADEGRSPEMIVLPAGCVSDWREADRQLQLYRGPSSSAIYYGDDGWRVSWGVSADAVRARLGTAGHLLRELAPGSQLVVTGLGARVPVRVSPAPSPEAPGQYSLRILALVPDAYGGHGGIARYNRDFFQALSGADTVDEVRILPRNAESDFVRSCGRLPLKLNQLSPVFTKWQYALRALWLAFRFRPDIVFCGHLHMTPLAALLSWLVGARLWVQVHGVEVFEKRSSLIRCGLKRASLVTAVSRYTRARLLAWAGIPAETVRVLPNTLDERYRPGDRDALKARHDYAGFKMVLTVSRLDARERYKGHDQVLAVLPDLLKTVPRLVYLIAGDGSDQGRLQRLVSEMDLTAHVRFLGRVNDEELLELYQMADVFVMPSTGEGFGIVFLEAAACGCAVVGGDRDGSVDALGEGAIGMAVNPNDAAALRAALRAALERPAPDAERVSRFRRARFEQHLNDLLSSILTNRQMPR